jgi:beta-mannanase
MHNESNADRTVDEPVKSTKKQKLKSAALATAFYGIPIAITAAGMIYSAKMGKMQFDTAKLNLAVAKTAAESL